MVHRVLSQQRSREFRPGWDTADGVVPPRLPGVLHWTTAVEIGGTGHGRKSTILTTNLEYEEWYGFLGQKDMVAALLDR
ncbi:MAG: hypothetical protein ABMB14_29280, partial [Myxococcota bacterium]